MWWRLRLREYLRTARGGATLEKSCISNHLDLKARPAAQPQESRLARQHFFFVARRRPVRRPAAPVARAFGQPFEGRMSAGMLNHPGQVARIVGREAEFGARDHEIRQEVEVL